MGTKKFADAMDSKDGHLHPPFDLAGLVKKLEPKPKPQLQHVETRRPGSATASSPRQLTSSSGRLLLLLRSPHQLTSPQPRSISARPQKPHLAGYMYVCRRRPST